MSQRIAPSEFGARPLRYASYPLEDLAHVRVLACPRGCDSEGHCKAATVVRKGDFLHYTPHVEKCARAGART